MVGLLALVVMYARASDRESQAHRRGPIGAVLDVIDASVGTYAIRRALGRSTLTRADRAAQRAREAAVAEAMAEEEVLRRISGEGPVPSPRPGSSWRARRPLRPRRRTGTARRTRSGSKPVSLALLMRRRETAVALLALTTALVLAVTVWPGWDGAVLEATGSPGTTFDGVVRTDETPDRRRA